MPSPKRRAKARHDAIAMTPEQELTVRLSGSIPPELAAVDDASGAMHLHMVAQALFVARRSSDPYFTAEGSAVQWAEAVHRIEMARRFRGWRAA
jgi:hypothetical protein